MKEIRDFIGNNLLFGAVDRLTDDTSFLEQGLIDSTGVLELVSMVEERYGIEVADNELIPDNFDSVNRMADYVNRKLNERSVSPSANGSTATNVPSTVLV